MQGPTRIAAISGLGEPPPASTGQLVAWGAILVLGGFLFWGALQEPKRVRMK